MSDQPKPPRLKSNPDNTLQNPTWTVTRRERTGTSPLRLNDESGAPYYHTRTITTTERVQILQMPLDVSDPDSSRLKLLSMSPTGEATRSVHSTTTTIKAGGTPIISGLTGQGVPLFNGIYMNLHQRQTTTVITTTTTTYKVMEDGSEEEYEMIQDTEDKQLTIDLPLDVASPGRPSNVSYVMIGSATDSSLSPITSEDDQHSRYRTSESTEDETEKGEWGAVSSRARTGRTLLTNRTNTSSSGSLDETDYVHLYKDGTEYVICPTDTPIDILYTNRREEMGNNNITDFVTVYHSGYSGQRSTIYDDQMSPSTSKDDDNNFLQSGRSDIEEPKHAEPVPEPAKEK
uniref:RIMS-binding protein 2 n=1 Tax=Bursaphelenchus xylophilus TaxID=6326 RepID=A0A1I7SDV8_BURXY